MSDTSKILRMAFRNAEGDRRSVSVRNPVDNPDAATVDALMDTIADNEVFEANESALIEKVDAVVVETTTTGIDLPE